jgi:GT2 family glycosyltransferase
MSQPPVVNITIPVFNRLHTTQKTILALRKCSREIPFAITVVDNGSEPELVERLVTFRKDGIIDNLFLIPRNMGISCAANVGWQMVDAPFYMKLDNDTVMKKRDWLPKLFRMWQHGLPLSTLGGAYDLPMLLKNPGIIETPDGPLGICDSNLPGQAVIIPKAVSDILGMWNEDYGLYGAEDGDYGMRMRCAGFPQYTTWAPKFSRTWAGAISGKFMPGGSTVSKTRNCCS